MSASTRRWYWRVWWTLNEPRVVSALMVTIYLALLTMAVLVIIEHHDEDDALRVAACLIMGAGALIGVPCAWRGAWWLEAPGALLCVLGLALLGVQETAQASYGDMPAYSVARTLVITLFFIMRVARIWDRAYAPWTGRDPTDRALARASIAEQEMNATQQWAADHCRHD